jgi:predicted dehydrogenase
MSSALRAAAVLASAAAIIAASLVPLTGAPAADKPLRVGLINCDLHGMYYSALFEDYDPLALRDDTVGRGHAAYFYFHSFYNDPRRMTVPKATGLVLAAVWDRNPALAENMAKIFRSRPRVCRSVEEVSDGVDVVFIADCNGDGADHFELAAPGLRKHVPTFIDKPLAADIETARKIVDLARREQTPLMSLSMLQTIPHARRFRARFEEIGSPEFGIIRGGGKTLAGQIHAIALALTLFGTDVAAVEGQGETPLAHFRLEYREGSGGPAAGVAVHCDAGGTLHAAYNASAFSSRGALHADDFGDYAFPYGGLEILERIKRMGRERILREDDYRDMLLAVEIASAARESQRSGRKVCLGSSPGD